MRNLVMVHAFEKLPASVQDTPVGSLIIQGLQRHAHAMQAAAKRKKTKRNK